MQQIVQHKRRHHLDRGRRRQAGPVRNIPEVQDVKTPRVKSSIREFFHHAQWIFYPFRGFMLENSRITFQPESLVHTGESYFLIVPRSHGQISPETQRTRENPSPVIINMFPDQIYPPGSKVQVFYCCPVNFFKSFFQHACIHFK